MKIAVTGHRNKRLRGRETQVATWLSEQIKGFRLETDKIECLCGGAEGTDEIFAEVAAFGNLDVDLAFYLPCEGYRYFALEKYMEKATRVVNIFPKWTAGGDVLRDCLMVDDCDVLLAVWDGIRVGGTWDTIKYAQENRKQIIFIDEKIFK